MSNDCALSTLINIQIRYGKRVTMLQVENYIANKSHLKGMGKFYTKIILLIFA